jgi:SAM-dependent methyltransferase
MLLRPMPISRAAAPLTVERVTLPRLARVAAVLAAATGMFRRRWDRERRRRQVGRAFDMALEVARIVPRHAQVLDVGCGNGFIAHHLSAMLGSSVVGIDLAERAAAPITYFRYDGRHFPTRDQSVDVVLFCYVLHHARDAGAVLREAQRVLRAGGVVIVYEDIPRTRWDRAICRTHDLQWRRRSGACTFRQPAEWRAVFTAAGFEVIAIRTLSRWRNLTHPVSREAYVLTKLTRSPDPSGRR